MTLISHLSVSVKFYVKQKSHYVSNVQLINFALHLILKLMIYNGDFLEISLLN
jgi:hypothetical protein